jgi:hypothetical protein
LQMATVAMFMLPELFGLLCHYTQLALTRRGCVGGIIADVGG